MADSIERGRDRKQVFKDFPLAAAMEAARTGKPVVNQNFGPYNRGEGNPKEGLWRRIIKKFTRRRG